MCAEHGMAAMAMADRDGVYGAPRFHMAMKKAGMRAHIGSEITFAPRRHGTGSGRSGDRVISAACRLVDQPEARINRKSKSPITNHRSPDHRITRLPLLVANREGYQNLCRLVTRMKARGPKDAPAEVIAAQEDDLQEHARGLICLTGGDDGPLAEALRRGGVEEGKRARRAPGLDLRPGECLRRAAAPFSARRRSAQHRRRGDGARAPPAARGDQRRALRAAEAARDPRRLHLPAHHRTLATAGRLLARNSERHVKSPAEMARCSPICRKPSPTRVKLSSRLQFTLADLGYEFPRYPVPEGETHDVVPAQARRGRRTRALRARGSATCGSARSGRSSASWR